MADEADGAEGEIALLCPVIRVGLDDGREMEIDRFEFGEEIVGFEEGVERDRVAAGSEAGPHGLYAGIAVRFLDGGNRCCIGQLIKPCCMA